MMTPKWHQNLSLILMLAPALLVIFALFMGGLALGIMQSLGYMPLIGQYDLSLAAYRAVFTRADFWHSLLLTLWIGGASTALSTIFALGGALALRCATRGCRWATFIFQLNTPIPHLVGALGILLLFSQSGFLARLAYAAHLIREPADFPALVYDRYAVGIILEYVWKSTCFTGMIVLAVLQAVGEDYETVARNLGANARQRFRYVTLPLLMPGVLSAAILVFAYTFGAFEVPYLLGQRYPSALPVLAFRSYTDVDLNARPEAMALSVIIAALITVLIFAYMRLARAYGQR